MVRSKSIDVTSEVSSDKSTPSIKSDLFSLLAKAAASLSEAFSERVYSDIPLALEFLLKSACKEIKISALFFFAILVLLLSFKKKSLSRVSITL